jgi:hypothetical protein
MTISAGTMTDSDKEGRLFFFEKKNPKTFVCFGQLRTFKARHGGWAK